jgi:type VI secretion system protein ImpM
MSLHAGPGWFGKVAMLGDFASRRLPSEWVQACDRWLSQGMQASQSLLGGHWMQTYLGAPVWRFAWAPGVVDAQWWFGVLMPSCDSVGRYFPLVVVQPRAQAPADRYALDHLELWWSQLAQAALQTLGDHASLEDFESALHETPPWPRPASTGLAQPLPGAERERHALPAGATLVDLASDLAASGLVSRLAGMSFWWSLRDPEHCTLHRGLPPAEAYAPMLSGRW